MTNNASALPPRPEGVPASPAPAGPVPPAAPAGPVPPVAPAQPSTPSKNAPLVVPLATVCALLWCYCAEFNRLSVVLGAVGGVGLSLCVLAFLASALVVSGKRPAPTPQNVTTLAATVLLALVPSVTSSMGTRVLNALALCVVGPLCYRMVCGARVDGMLSLQGMLGAVGFFIRSQFAHLLLLASVRGKARRQAGPVAVGLLVSVLVLVVVLPLLTAADESFSAFVDDLFAWISLDVFAWFLRLARFAFVLLVSVSLLNTAALGEGRPKAYAQSVGGSFRGGSVATVLAILNAVYLLFVAVQLHGLASGMLAGAHGSYAASAREGFFQMVTVAFINVAVIATCLWGRKNREQNALICGLEAAMIVLTGALVGIAARRMTAYVLCYGLTGRRLLTYLAMVIIAVTLALMLVRAFNRRFPAFKIAAAAITGIWIAYALSCPDARIAWFNARGYQSGLIQNLDVTYLHYSLGSEAHPAVFWLEQNLLADDEELPKIKEFAALLRDGTIYRIGDEGFWPYLSAFELLG